MAAKAKKAGQTRTERRKAAKSAGAKARKVAKAAAAKKSPPKKGRVGKPQFQPTEDDRYRVALAAGLMGFREEEICLLVINPATDAPISPETLRLHFKLELETATAGKHFAVAESLYKRAIDLEHQHGATCAIFLAKTRMGYKERTVAEVEVKSGVLIPPAGTSPEDWIAQQEESNAGKKEPGT